MYIVYKVSSDVLYNNNMTTETKEAFNFKIKKQHLQEFCQSTQRQRDCAAYMSHNAIQTVIQIKLASPPSDSLPPLEQTSSASRLYTRQQLHAVTKT